MLSAGVLACSFLFISAPWLTVSLSAAESATSRVVVTGAAAVPVLIGLILAYLAAMIVATLVHPIVRCVCRTCTSSAASVRGVAGTAALVKALAVNTTLAFYQGPGEPMAPLHMRQENRARLLELTSRL
jgi:hypothetical protein